jgi:hypothetical protein
VLKQAEIPIIDVAKCNSTRYTDGQVFNTNICAGYDKGGIDTCQVFHCVTSVICINIFHNLSKIMNGCQMIKKCGKTPAFIEMNFCDSLSTNGLKR